MDMVQVFQRTKLHMNTFLVWCSILLAAEISGAVAEKCRKKFNQVGYLSEFDPEDDEKYVQCMWGCCYNRDTPCCTAPISLIIGCAIGGIILVAIATVAICCCWACRKRDRANRSAVLRFGGARSADCPPPHVIYHSESSGVELPPYVYDAPPSYDEVMRGETNSAFKPDNS